MATAVFLIGLPALVFLVLLFCGQHLGRSATAFFGYAGLFVSACYALCLLWLNAHQPATREIIWSIVPASLPIGFNVDFAIYVDSLALTMAVVVSFISAWIGFYSAGYMKDDDGVRRYFAIVNLFVAFMMMLVLADNLWLLFLGWEGVGLSSYLLIGYYYTERKAEAAALKAFLTTRIGDVFLLFAMFLCFALFKTVNIEAILSGAQLLFPHGGTIITVIAFCILAGAAGKSAQLPLQIWLPDAMWGPTPVSALIHAATMVTAGVYLIARMALLFSLSYEAAMAVLVVGIATMLLGGILACLQTDLKRVLAYSTMSQIGLMFMALGASSYHGALFHLVTHAFFKALLFLGAGVIGHAVHHYDLMRMGGLRKSMPVMFWLFLLGCLNLVGAPFVSAGFFSKDLIMSQIIELPEWGHLIFGLATFGFFLTGFYTFRMIVLVFFNEQVTSTKSERSVYLYLPLIVLSSFLLVMGWIEMPHFIGDIHIFSDFLSSSLATFAFHEEEFNILPVLLPSLAAFIGAFLAVGLYGGMKLHRRDAPSIVTLIKDGGLFDQLYKIIFISPFTKIAFLLKNDPMHVVYNSFSGFIRSTSFYADRLHTGRLSHYTSFFIVAALALASLMVF